MRVILDPRIEAISTIQYLSNYSKIIPFPLLNKEKSVYTDSIDTFFSNMKDHKVLSITEKLATQGFVFDAPYYFAYNLNTQWKLEADIENNYLGTRISIKDAEEYNEAIKDFIKKSRFEEFIEIGKTIYNNAIMEVCDQIKSINAEKELENYFRQKIGESEIILSIINNGNFGVWNEKNNRKAIIIGLMGQLEKVKINTLYIRSLSWHELSHSIVNPIIDNLENIINRYELLFIPIKDKMEQCAYPNWKTAIIEHLIRACTNRLILKYYGKEQYDKANKKEYENGFVYISSLLKALEKYEMEENISFSSYIEKNIAEIMENLTPAKEHQLS
ncbi:MAG: DUF4932 domain-containing protein [Treponema sp.]|nr:DUF4932 domain-containing protein [Treponema sp.]